MQRGSHFANIVHSSESEERISYCSTCAAIGKLSRLKVRIYLNEKGKLIQPQPQEADSFLMCYVCGLIIPTRDAMMQGKISPIIGVQPVASPADNKKTILGNDTKHRYQRLKKQKNRHEDPEVQRELDRGNLVNDYHTSMPT